MFQYYPYLSDLAFLAEIDLTAHKTSYVRLTVMDMQDVPIDSIEGISTAGNVSVNGKSSLRRSGSLTLVAADTIKHITQIDNLIALHRRVFIELGYKNIWDKYTDFPTIWFPQGAFVITTASCVKNTTASTISVTIKDKMALLNGECGGILPAAITHHPLYNEVNIAEPAPVRDLLYTLLTVYGQLPANKIIIEDIPLLIKNTMRWTGLAPVYSTGSAAESNFLLSLTKDATDATEYNFNQSLGYNYVPFTYPAKTLTSAAGDTVVSVLDKIKNTLGNYEYFFDVYGYFRFREQRNYINEGSALENWSTALNEKYLTKSSSWAEYSFGHDLKLISSISNAPQYNAIKNDITLWGERSDTGMALRYHLLIDRNIPPKKSYSQVIKFYKEKDSNGNAFGPWRLMPPAWIENATLYATSLEKVESSKEYTLNLTPSAELDWRTWHYLDIVLNNKQDPLSAEIKTEWPKLINLPKELGLAFTEETLTNKWRYVVGDKADTAAIDWYLDILDTSVCTALDWMSISAIGRREKVVTDKTINCLFEPNFNDVVLIPTGEATTASQREQASAEGNVVCQVQPDIWRNISTGIASCAAYDVMRSMLHEITGYNETISFTTVPIYHLEPNTRIFVQSNDSDIFGDYLINSYNINFATGGNITFNCSKAVERI